MMLIGSGKYLNAAVVGVHGLGVLLRGGWLGIMY